MGHGMSEGGLASNGEGPIGRPRSVGRLALRALDWASRGTGGLAETLGLCGLGFGIALQLVNLVMRNIGLTGDVPNWLDDGSTLSLVDGAFVYWAATDRHIGFGGLVGYLPSLRAQIIIHRLAGVVVAALLTYLTVEGIELVENQAGLGGSYSSAFDFPLWLFYAIAPLTFGISAIRRLRRALGPESELLDETFDSAEA